MFLMAYSILFFGIHISCYFSLYCLFGETFGFYLLFTEPEKRKPESTLEKINLDFRKKNHDLFY